jgi:hypothetical protein
MSLKKNSIVSKIKSLFKDNKMVEETQEIIQEEVKPIEKRIFQWKKGDDFGKIVEVKSEDDEFFYFTDGSQIYKNIVDDYLEDVYDVNFPPFPSHNSIQSVTNKKTEASLVELVPEKKVDAEISPLEKLIIKLSSKNVESINVSLGINLPKHEVFEMLLENGDDTKEEMINTISRVVASQIEIHKLQNYINEQVTKFLNNYYE